MYYPGQIEGAHEFEMNDIPGKIDPVDEHQRL
jgi:hypothetical protein